MKPIANSPLLVPTQCKRGERENENNAVKLPVLVPLSSYVSYGTYHERVRRHQDLRTPKQSQRMPLTTAQQYGWWLPQEPMVKVDGVYPWSQTIRHPMINSPMTRFVDKMAVTNKGFRLF
ncbi:sperm microtubule inner protein 11 isoform X2 [Mixophyes fleayi]|uniref:sperm microtubule inner protein 11 isoform X2 n=1 Tax=Mixophyes fleayi TaxID=3061075 RepID=UPI003F4E08D7